MSGRVSTDPAQIPPATGTTFAVAAGHHLAAEAGAKIYRDGGNVFDAAVAATLVCAVTEPGLFGPGGEVTGIIHHEGRTRVLAGCTRAPKKMTIDAFRAYGLDLIPGSGLLAAGPPALLESMIVLLREYGTVDFATAAAPAIDLCVNGFDMCRPLAAALATNKRVFLDMWPTSAQVWLNADGSVPARAVQPALGDTLGRLAQSADPLAELRTGFVARAIAEFAAQPHPWPDGTGNPHEPGSAPLGGVHAGFLTGDDLAEFSVAWEPSYSWTDRHGRQIHKAGPYTQGPVLLQMMQLLEAGGFDALEPASAEFLHAYLECAKLAFADREGFYGDGADISALLDPGYAAGRARPVGSRAGSYGPGLEGGWVPPGGEPGRGSDTTHVDVADHTGDVAVLTPSGGWFSSPVIPSLGFPLGTRCQMFRLDPASPLALVPGRRPRTTLTPTLVLRDGKPFIALGTPGGDTQDQIQVQMLHGLAHGMSPADVVDMPTVVSTHFPSSFYPRGSVPLGANVEAGLPGAELSSRGHRVTVNPRWSHGRPQVIRFNEDGSLTAAASRRIDTAGAIAF